MGRKHKIQLDSEDRNGEQSREKTKESRLHTGDDVNPWTGKPYSAKYHSILQTRTKLPVYQFKDKLIQQVQDHQIVVVEGETGSGESAGAFLCASVPYFILTSNIILTILDGSHTCMHASNHIYVYAMHAIQYILQLYTPPTNLNSISPQVKPLRSHSSS